MTARCWLVALMLTACGGGDADLIVDLRTDYVPGIEFTEVEVVRLVGEGTEGAVQTLRAMTGDDFIAGRGVAQFDVGDPRVILRARLLAADGRRVAERLQEVAIDGRTGITIVITRDCEGIVCTDGEQCVDAVCVPPSCSPERPDLCGELVLCGSDAACRQPEAECAEAICTDGLCFDRAILGACGEQEYCVPEDGCVTEPGVTDAGVPDAGRCDTPCVLEGTCETGTLDCSDEFPVCVATGVVEAGTPCRESTGECDPQEVCDGINGVCPVDTVTDAGTACADGFCDGAGVCSSGCTPGADCARPSICELGTIDCSSGVPECVGAGPADAGVECRAAAGACDVAETCDGADTVCPADEFATGATTCRAAAGECDVAEQCAGEAVCPPDDFESVGTACGAGFCDGLGACMSGCTPGAPCATANDCEVGEITCASGMPACMGVGPLPAGIECRASAGECDVAETCDGSSRTCPSNSFDSTTICRASTGPCDLAETCSGSSAVCPSNSFRPSTFECRASMGACDVPETCPGSGANCPADVFQSGTTCRSATGACDVAEVCPGMTPDCPNDAVQPNTFECRAVAGVCDERETCDGVSKNCPSDGFLSGVVCRPGGMCNPSESCTGTEPDCPTDGFTPAGTTCFGGNECADYECNGSGGCQFVGGGCPPSRPICCEPMICINSMEFCP